MKTVPLVAVPNQSIAFNVDGAYWQIRVYQAIEMMYADVSRNDEVLIQGVRCLVGQALLPYEYMYSPNFGNLIFDAPPDWEQFGDTCNLQYLNAAEFAEYKALEVASWQA